ncbi:MAG: hypothetical protein ACI9FN_001561, partial [Saprospiraceae bacterium]
MLTFLRKIRRSLINSGSAQKYLLYAIGEIALVVIGILIALSINNWNQEGKNNILENEYYCSLLEDVEQDQEQLGNLFSMSKNRLAASNQAVRLLQKEKANKAEVGIQMNLSIKGSYAYFVPNISAFDDLKSGANLNIIKDKSIIKSMNNYFNNINGYSKILESNVENSLRRYFKYDDLFSTGWVHGHMSMSRLQQGMDEDVYERIIAKKSDVLSVEIQSQLYNDAIYFVSINARRIEVYDLIENEIEVVKALL